MLASAVISFVSSVCGMVISYLLQTNNAWWSLCGSFCHDTVKPSFSHTWMGSSGVKERPKPQANPIQLPNSTMKTVKPRKLINPSKNVSSSLVSSVCVDMVGLGVSDKVIL